MTTDDADPMVAEFDTVAAWTEQAVAELGQDYAVIAGCRGSGSPMSLAWLAEALEVHRSLLMLDAGAGVGGPAGWAAERFRVQPVCLEPMQSAAGACQRMFGLPTIVGDAVALPFGAATFDVAWSLGVLCTTSEKPRLLAELRRVLQEEGRLGLLVYVAAAAAPLDTPEGNEFPSRSELFDLLSSGGFTVIQTVDAPELGSSPVAWQSRADRVEALIAERHRDDPRWQQADRQAERIGELVSDGSVRAVLIHAVAT